MAVSFSAFRLQTREMASLLSNSLFLFKGKPPCLLYSLSYLEKFSSIRVVVFFLSRTNKSILLLLPSIVC